MNSMALTEVHKHTGRQLTAAARISARQPGSLTTWLSQRPFATSPPSPSRYLRVSSDGHGRDFLEGLAVARLAFGRYANILDIPMDILQSDRWCMPWVSCYESSGFDVKFCVDGKGYVEHIKSGDWYCFETHLALAQFLDRTRLAQFPRQHKVRFGAYVDNVGSIEPN